jgi:hypothetical protein
MDEKVYTIRKGIALRAQARGAPLTINMVNHDTHLGRGPNPVAKYAGNVEL